MSSNMRILKICDYCSKEFIAKKTTTKCCSDDCAKRFYKFNKRNDKISQAELKTEIRRQLKAFITEDEIRSIQAKKYLTLKEAAVDETAAELLISFLLPSLKHKVYRHNYTLALNNQHCSGF